MIINRKTLRKPILFFGYGANRDIARIKEVIGKEPYSSYGAMLEGYMLAWQNLDQLPLDVQRVLREAWGEKFRSYTIKPGNGVVNGTVWEMNQDDFEKMKRWEFIGQWREIIEVEVELFRQTKVKVFTEKNIDTFPISTITDGLNYENNLNPTGKKITGDDKYRIKEINRILKDLEKYKNSKIVF